MSGTMRFDAKSPWDLRWFNTDAEIIAHGEMFVEFEGQRPAPAQLKDISAPFVRVLLTAAKKAAEEADTGELGRAHAAEALRQADEQLPALVDRLMLHLKSRHAANLADMERYKLKTTAGSHGVSVQKPRNVLERRAFCLAYVEIEAALPAAQQISDPPLSQMQALAAVITANQAEWNEQIIRRQRNVATRSTAAQKLQEVLQAAAAVLIVTCFGGEITRDLKQWGYDVVAKTSPTPEPPTLAEESESANS